MPAVTLHRRALLATAGATASAVATSHVAATENYPSRAVRIVVGLPAGNSPDLIARLLGEWLGERLGQPFLVEDRPGANTNIATELVVRAAPDGYTLLFATAGNSINASVYKNLTFNFIRDVAPVARIGGTPVALVVTPSLPARTVPEFIAYLKANPGRINMGSAGNGSLLHAAGALFQMMTGTDFVHVPYRGSLFPDLLSGQIQVAFSPTPATLGYIRTGKLRALGVSTRERLDVLPDVPPIADFVPGYEVLGWLGIVAPRGTPPAIVERLHETINAAMADAKFRGKLGELGVIPRAMSVPEFAAFIAAETEKWAKVVTFANIQPE